MAREVDSIGLVGLRQGVVLAPAGDGRWQARWDFDQVSFLEGAACASVLPWLAPMLAAGCETEALRREAATRGAGDLLGDILALLRGEGLLDAEMATHTARPDLYAAVAGMTASPQEALDAAHRLEVRVVGHAPLAAAMVRALGDQGLGTSAPCSLDDALAVLAGPPTNASPAPFFVLLDTDWPAARLADFNRAALAVATPWMLVGAWNARLLVGPIFVPGETACLVCLRRRLDSHRRHPAAHAAAYSAARAAARAAAEEWLADRSQATRGASLTSATAAEPLLPSLAALAAAWTAHEVFCFATRLRQPRTVGRVLVYRPDDAHLSVETVLRVPWCAACGAHAPR